MTSQLRLLLLFALLTVASSACATPTPTNCDICYNSSACYSCNPGYQLMQDFTCAQIPILQGCKVYSGIGRCEVCLQGFNLNAGACFPPVENCEVYGPGNACVGCVRNYTVLYGRCELANNTECRSLGQGLLNGVCIQIPVSNCLEIVNGTICRGCSQGYRLVNGLCFRLGELRQPACSSPRNDGTCVRCNPPYYLNTDGQCYNILIDNCVSATGIVCTQCQQNYVLTNGGCFRPPKLDDPNCNVVNPISGACTGCNLQYFLNSSGYCIKQDLYCLTTSPNGSCTSCRPQLRLVSGQCIFPDSNCINVDYQNVLCRQCRKGYNLSPNRSNCILGNTCLQFNNGRCVSCSPAYQLINNQCILLPTNCWVMDNTGQCSSCLPKTSLRNGICVYLTVGCESYEGMTGVCDRCADGYYLENGQCVGYGPGCDRVGPGGRCTGCVAGFQLMQGVCVRMQGNCATTGFNGCEKCADGYYITLARQCLPFPQKCLYVSPSGDCVHCLPGTISYNGKCVSYQTFCLDYNSQTTLCNTVPRDFYLSGSNVTHHFASQWNTTGDFTFCRTGYQYNNNSQSCVVTIPNCMFYDQMANCSRCIPGYGLSNGACVAGVCVRTVGIGCAECVRGYVLVNGSCYNRSNFGLEWDSNGQVLRTQIGYSMSSYGMALSLRFNCIRQDYTNGTCLECAKYYTWWQNFCVVFDANCLRYNARGICQLCRTDYRFIYGACRFTANCLTFSDACTSCRQGYMLSSGTCLQLKTQNCAFYTPTMQCLACQPGYSLTSSSTCTSRLQFCQTALNNTFCQQCLPDYILLSGQCFKRVANCFNYSQDTGVCTSCQPRYQLVNSSCYQLPQLCQEVDINTLRCVRCLPGYVLVNGNQFCARSVENCTGYNSDGSCNRCVDGMRLSNGRCVIAIANCVRVVNSQCVECVQGYTLQNFSQCVLLTNNCMTYSPSTGLCTTCFPGFYLQNSTCLQNPPNCLTFTNETCLQCVQGFTLRNSSCIFNNDVYMDGCQTRASPVQCLTCLPGFTLFNFLCRALFCQRFSQSGLCLQCPLRFTLLNGLCVIDNCTRRNSQGMCEVCQEGFEIAVDGNKRYTYCRVKNCRKLAENQGCLECVEGYYLNGIACVVANCSTVVGGVCYGCVEGFQLANGICRVGNCRTVRGFGCEVCANNFVLRSDGVCVRDLKCNRTEGIKCLVCNSGYTLESDGVCRLAFCRTTVNETFCSQCITGFQPINGLCQPQNCLTSTAQGCSQCSLGYTLLSNSTCTVSSCRTLAPTRDSCLVCNPRFLNFNGLCRPADCRILLSNTLLCGQCLNRYFSSLDGACLAKNCSNFDDQKECVRCDEGFKLVHGFCYFVNCLRNDDARCLQCYPGFEMEGNGVCTRQICERRNSVGDCVSCSQGYRMFNTGNGVLCVSYYCNQTQNNRCLTCLQGFTLYPDGYCYLPDPCRSYLPNPSTSFSSSCSSCIPGYTLVNSSCTVKNCQSLDDWNNCVLCYDGFFLRNLTCVAQNCMVYDNSTLNCVECLVNYALRSDGSCRVKNCNFVYYGVCVRCLPGYRLVNGVCTFSLCERYDGGNSSGVCLACVRGYNLVNNTCVSDACQSLLPNTEQCSQCKPNFKLVNGYCVSQQFQIILGCLNYNFFTLACQQCSTGFSLTNDQHCQSRYCLTSSPTACLACLPGYVLVENNTRCLAQYCMTYDKLTYDCQGCMSGYVLRLDGKCEYRPPLNCPEGQYEVNRTCVEIGIKWCVRVDRTGEVCERCIQGRVLVNNKCVNVTNCESYDDRGCLGCMMGYYLNNTVCEKSQIANCNQSEPVTGRCLSCISPYILYNNTCVDSSINCNRYNSSGCISCSQGYTNISGLCYKLPNNCQSLYPNLTCSRCLSGYILITGTCTAEINYCVGYQDSKCVNCRTGYKLTEDGRCTGSLQNCVQYTSTGGCARCQQGYVVVADPRNAYVVGCRKVIENCVRYGGEGCVECRVGFKTLVVGGTCVQATENCEQYDATNRCTTCSKGYYLSFQNFSCIKNPENCNIVYEDVCRECKAGARLLNGLCVSQAELANCVRYNTTLGQCTECADGYYLDKARCVEIGGFCARGTPGNCTDCLRGYQLYNGTCYAAVSNCNSFGTNGNCTSCNSGYYLSTTNTCQQLPSNCLNASRNGSCLNCSNTTYLSTSFTCLPLPPNCLTASSNSSCLNCSINYTLQAGLCYETLPYCLTYNTVGCSQCRDGFRVMLGICLQTTCQYGNRTGCLQCLSGYRLEQGLCVNECVRRSSDGRCEECQRGWTLWEGVCYVTVAQCVRYEQGFGCRGCANGYYLSVNGTCNTNPRDCVQVSNTGACLSCAEGYQLTNGVCNVPAIPTNCEVRNSFGGCIRCATGYFLSGGQCVLLPPGCRVPDRIGCLACSPAYQLRNSNCILRIPFCADYTASGSCSICTQGSFLVFGRCTATPNCQLVSDNGTCTSCLSGYRLQPPNCILLLPNCLTYSPNGSCLTCTLNYTLFNGQCVVANTNYTQTTNTRLYCTRYDQRGYCIGCAKGYLLTSANQCVPEVANCVQYTTDLRICSRCENGYYLAQDSACVREDGNCVTRERGVCVNCRQGYVLSVNRVCVVNINFCARFSDSGLCLTCQPGFTLTNTNPPTCQRLGNSPCLQTDPTTNRCLSCPIGSNLIDNSYCVLTIVNCQDYNQNGTCTRCIPGCTLINNRCLQNPPNCNRVSFSGACLECNAGYNLNTSGICVQVNCLAVEGGRCGRCRQGFVLWDGACIVPTANCRVFAINTGLCVECQGNYTFIASTSQCQQTPSNCLRVNPSGFCAECLQGYTLLSGLCQQQITIQNCQVSSGGICLTCNPGYYWNLNRRACLELPSNCLNADPNGICTQCTSGFRLGNGMCMRNVEFCVEYGGGNDGGCVRCVNGYGVFQGGCVVLPAYCVRADRIRCLECIRGYNLSNGQCIASIPNCAQYDQSSRCTSCNNLYYLLNNQCVPYPSRCISVDQLGNCLDCCYGSYLQLGSCTTFSSPSENCNAFDRTAGTCQQCSANFQYSTTCRSCVKYDPNCYSYTTIDRKLCTGCHSGFYLMSGMCLTTPPGLQSSLGGVIRCRPTYFLQNNKCYKNLSSTRPISNRSGTTLIYSSVNPTLPQPITPRINGPSYWQPLQNTRSQFVGYRSQTPTTIQSLQLQGNGRDEWINEFTIQYRDSSNSTVKCYQNCAVFKGNSDGTGVVTMNFQYPIVATEVRVNPQNWSNGGIGTRLEFYTD